MSIDSKIQILTNTIGTFKNKLLAAFQRSVDMSNEADNTAKLGNQTIAQLRQSIQNRLNDHNVTNAHGLTAESIGGLSREAILLQINTRLVRGGLPLSSFKAGGITLLDRKEIIIYDLTISLSGLTYSFPTDFVVSFPQLNLGDVRHLSATLSGGELSFVVTEDPLPEDETNLWITKFTVQNNQQALNFYNISRYGFIRRSSSMSGSSFLSTTKNVNEPNTKTIW